jgi:hypothetical protein
MTCRSPHGQINIAEASTPRLKSRLEQDD